MFAATCKLQTLSEVMLKTEIQSARYFRDIFYSHSYCHAFMLREEKVG